MAEQDCVCTSAAARNVCDHMRGYVCHRRQDLELNVNVVQNTPPIEQAINDRLAEVKTLTFSDAPYERPQGEVRCEDVPLRAYRVAYHDIREDEAVLYFDCMADDEDHAVEQVKNAYPAGNIRIINVAWPDELDDPLARAIAARDNLRGASPRTEPVTLEDVTHVLSRVEVLLDTWELLIGGNAVIKTNDHTVEMTSLAMDVITCLRDELITMADNMRGSNDA